MHAGLVRRQLAQLALVVGLAAAVGLLPATGYLVSPAFAAPPLVPVADTYVDASSATRNYGTRTYLRADSSPVRIALVRFDVQGVTDFSSAILQVFAESGTTTGFDVRSVATNTWGETTTTYQNAPTIGPVVTSSGPVSGGTWVSLDVSSLVTGTGLVSFALTTTGTTAIRFSSREAANAPKLNVPAPPNASPFVVTSLGGGVYEAESQTTGTTYTGSLKTAVQSAVHDLDSTGGGTVSFSAGTFDLGSDFFKLENIEDITFEGQGMDTTVIQNSSSAAADTEPFNFSGAFGVTIRDLTVVAGGPARTTSDAIDFDQGNNSLVERVKITASRARGVIFDGKNAGWTANGNVVRDCVIDSVTSHGIELLASSNNVIENCTITNAGGYGIQVTKSSASADQPNKKSNNNVVTGNTIDNAGQDGIDVLSSDGNQIVGNTVTNSANVVSGRDGIRIASANSVTCDDNVVKENLATDTQEVKTQSYGLNITSSLCNRTLVIDNDFTGNRVSEIRDMGTDTQIVSNDNEAPSQPTDLTTTLVEAFRVDLSWSASTDNVAVTGYTVYRDGAPIGTVGGATLTYSDTSTSGNTTYTYAVDAFDAADNHSAPSDPIEVTTPPPPSSFTLNPEADSYVKEDSASSNFGSSSSLRADASPDTRSYLRFTVTGISGTIASVKLRIYANSASSVGHDVRGVADNTWGESTITYANAPVVGAVAGSSGPFAGGAYIEVDVTSLVTGNGTYSFSITTPHTTAISYGSRESSNKPELVIDLS